MFRVRARVIEAASCSLSRIDGGGDGGAESLIDNAKTRHSRHDFRVVFTPCVND